MSDQPFQNDDPGIKKELRPKIETLQQQEAVEKLTRSQEARSTGQRGQPTEAGDQAALKKMVGDKQFDASTQARSTLERSAPALAEQGMDRQVEGKIEVNKQIHDVPLSQIKPTGINGPDDFRAGSYDGMRQELERLQHLKPYVEAGQGEQVAEAWDRQLKMGAYSETGYTRGYVDAYKTY